MGAPSTNAGEGGVDTYLGWSRADAASFVVLCRVLFSSSSLCPPLAERMCGTCARWVRPVVTMTAAATVMTVTAAALVTAAA